MATANINAKTGVPFGVIQGNSVPDLLEEIQMHGQNLTYDDWKERLTSSVRTHLMQAIEDFIQPRAQIENTVRSVEEEVVGLLTDNDYNYGYEAEEENYLWEAPDGCRYKLGYLGGAPLIWVLFSPWVTEAPHCSPCVPGAGDLNNPHPGGLTCYCVAPEWLPEDTDLKPRALPVQAAQSEEAV